MHIATLIAMQMSILTQHKALIILFTLKMQWFLNLNTFNVLLNHPLISLGFLEILPKTPNKILQLKQFWYTHCKMIKHPAPPIPNLLIFPNSQFYNITLIMHLKIKIGFHVSFSSLTTLQYNHVPIIL